MKNKTCQIVVQPVLRSLPLTGQHQKSAGFLQEEVFHLEKDSEVALTGRRDLRKQTYSAAVQLTTALDLTAMSLL